MRRKIIDILSVFLIITAVAATVIFLSQTNCCGAAETKTAAEETIG